MRVLRTGKGGYLAADGHLLVGDVVKGADEMHPSAVVKEQRLIVASAGTGDVIAQLACADDLVAGGVYHGDAAFTDDQQLLAVVHVLKAEGFGDLLQIDDLYVFAVNDDEVTGKADGVYLAIFGSVDVAEAIVLVAQQAGGLHLASLDVVLEYFAIGAHGEHAACLGSDVDA